MANLLSSAALAGAEQLINRALAYDPATQQALGKLQGQVLAIDISLPALHIYLLPDSEGLCLMNHWEGEVNTRVKGSLPALVQLAKGDNHSLYNSGVEMIGQTGLLADWKALVNNLDIDWEEMLSQLLGDVLGHQSAELIRSQLHWAGERAASGKRLLGEFISEELNAVPSKPELNHFYQQVDELRLAVDRAAARVEKLLQQQKPQEKPTE